MKVFFLCYVGWEKRVWVESDPFLRYEDMGKRKKQKQKKILQKMITNFKSDYGNLLLSGLATTELNIPWQIKSGSRNFYDSLNGRGGEEKAAERSLKRIKITITTLCPTSNIPSKILQFSFPGAGWIFGSWMSKEWGKTGEKRKTFRWRFSFLRFFDEKVLWDDRR